MSNLEVHHIQYRGQSGEDSESNLITLCQNCHRAIHV
jgi:5-methylcytosine-specific restriction endonuclease McrA